MLHHWIGLSEFAIAVAMTQEVNGEKQEPRALETCALVMMCLMGSTARAIGYLINSTGI